MASNVYNPWAVTKYLNEVVQNKFEPGNYWVKSGASIMLEKLLCYITSKNMQQSLWTLIEGKEERLEFEKDANLLRRYDYAPETIQQPLAYLLLHSGYLTVKRTAESYFFKIPNYEVKAEFTRVVGAVLENLEKTGLPYNSHAIDINGCGNFIVKNKFTTTWNHHNRFYIVFENSEVANRSSFLTSKVKFSNLLPNSFKLRFSITI